MSTHGSSHTDPASIPELTADGMLAFLNASKQASPENLPNSSPKRSRRSRERSAAVLVAAMFNGMRSDQDGAKPKGTVYADMIPCLEDIVIEYESPTDVGAMTLVVFGLPEEGSQNRFTLNRVTPTSSTKWEYDGLIQLPKTMPDLTFVVESGVLGDIGYLSLTAAELAEAKSAPRSAQDDPATIERDLACGDSESQEENTARLSLSVTSVLTEKTKYVVEEPDTRTIRPGDVLHKPIILINRGRELKSRFNSTEIPQYLDQAIDTFSQALDLMPPPNRDDSPKGHLLPLNSNRSVRINILLQYGQALSERFALFGKLADVDLAIPYLEEALSLSTTGDDVPLTPQRNGFARLPLLLASAQRYLGVALIRRFDRLGGLGDLQCAIDLQRRECSTPGELLSNGTIFEDTELVGHSFAWSRLGTYLMRLFGRLGSLQDIDEAVECQRTALRLLLSNEVLMQDPGHCAFAYSDLGAPLLQRFKVKGTTADIEEAVLCFREAASIVRERGPDHLDVRSIEVFNGLGMTLMRRYEHLGDVNDINEAISAQQQALRLVSPHSQNLHTLLNNLSLCYQRHYAHTRDMDSLREAVASLRRAIDVTPSGHPMLATTLNNFATAACDLSDVSQTTDSVDLIHEAITAQTKAIELTPTTYPSLSQFHDNLGHFYRALFSATSDIAAIEHTINSQRKALTLSSPSHPEFSLILSSLGASLYTRYEVTSDAQDLRESISLTERSLDLTPNGHSTVADRQGYLAKAYLSLQRVTGETSNFDRAFSLFSLAAACPTTPPRRRLAIARQWAAQAALIHSQDQTLAATEVIMELVSLVAGLEQTLEHRYEHLSEFSMIVLNAAMFAVLLAQRPDKALQWLEQGRGLVWRQLTGLRTPLDDLRGVDPTLAHRLQTLSQDLEQASMVQSRRMTPGLALSGDRLETRMSLHEQAAHQVQISTEREKVLETIRATIPGFQNFLQSSSTTDIFRHLPNDGPVVVLGAHPAACYALALLSGLDEPLYIPLPLSWARARDLASLLQAALTRYGVRSRGPVEQSETLVDDVDDSHSGDEDTRGIRRYSRKISSDYQGIGLVLRELWLEVVKPIIEALALSRTSRGDKPTRIWWCPTGPLTSLPIHAAGIYTGDEAVCLADFAVSSYTPTVAVLTERVKNARSAAPVQSHVAPGLFMVSQPNTPGCAAIPGTTVEADSVSRQLELSGVPLRWLDGEQATVEAGLNGMKEFNFIHLACHATQRQDQPLESGFYLHDGRLDLSTIMKSNLRTAELAFLSACQTSTGSGAVPEEAVHLAAGMLSAGYRGVVATMWSIQDDHAPQIAEDFYDYLLGCGENGAEAMPQTQLDGRGASYALHHATRMLRERLGDSDLSFLAWVPYVHFGL